MSSVAIFTNALSQPQMQTLYNAGFYNGNPPAYITLQPQPTNAEVISGGSVTLTSAGFVGGIGIGGGRPTMAQGGA